jgi:hypothetical protein
MPTAEHREETRVAVSGAWSSEPRCPLPRLSCRLAPLSPLRPRLCVVQVAVCFAAYRNLAHIARMRVAWTGGQLRLWLDLEHTKTYQLCLETALNDHRMASLPKSGYLGLSASTGAYGDAHVVYSMAAAKLDAKHPEQERIATPHVAALDEAPLDPSHEVPDDVRTSPALAPPPRLPSLAHELVWLPHVAGAHGGR